MIVSTHATNSEQYEDLRTKRRDREIGVKNGAQREIRRRRSGGRRRATPCPCSSAVPEPSPLEKEQWRNRGGGEDAQEPDGGLCTCAVV